MISDISTQSEKEKENKVIREKMRPVTIRFSQGAYSAIDTIAVANGMSMADVVRLAIDLNLVKYLSNIQYVDYAQGREIAQTVAALYRESADIKLQLKRIGINFNQAVMRRHIERQYGARINASSNRDERIRLRMEMQEKLKGIEDHDELDLDKIENLIARYEAAAKEAGDVICRILQ